MAQQHVYSFGAGTADGDRTMKNTLGGKGANLAEMSKTGLPVPAGFTIDTDVCVHYSKHDGQYPDGVKAAVESALKKVEEAMGARFGCDTNPLLLSCRSGARESMPGMMDTVLNIGLNEKTVDALIKQSGDERFAWDSYRRFVQMYGDVVLGVDRDEQNEDPFETIIDEAREKAGVEYDYELSADQLKEIVTQFKQVVKEQKGREFPDDPMDQLWGAIGAVFDSWDNDRAVVYRRQYGIPHEWGTATNVQAMVYGNLGDDCATGVGLTRDGADGTPGFNGDYLINAQGEDVVAGIRTPKRIEETLEKEMPAAFKELTEIGEKLEAHYKDIQDIEFTVQKGKVWMLQTRNAKRTGFAAVRIAHDLVEEGVIDSKEALNPRRIPADDLNQLLQPIFDPAEKKAAADRHLTTGINAGPGAASGKVVLTAEAAEAQFNKDENVSLILVRKETSPEDLRGMRVAKGILTAQGGASSHAALVSRQMGKACIVGAQELQIDYAKKTVSVGDKMLKEGDDITIDGFTGEVFAGTVTTSPSEVMQVLNGEMQPERSETYQRYNKIMAWADEHRTLNVRANAESEDAQEAVAFGAEGIGLCRTEHMFFNHLDEIREMILAETAETRQKAVDQLLPFQKADFTELFTALAGKPVTIRLLDPPLHEFLSDRHLEEEPGLDEKLAKIAGVSKEDVHRRVSELHELNPMLGHRGCRLGVVYPEVTRMQATAIFEAAVATKQAGHEVFPEVMIPLVGFKTEFENQAKVVREAAKAVLEKAGVDIPYTVGTMIEIPRAALRADEIAEGAEFFSFGTNDLTQTTLGISRDDYGTFMPQYREMDIVPADPFQTIDQPGVGRLMKIGIEGGRKTNPDLKIGICGEHGGDPKSVMFCHDAGLNYVSCSPRRIPIARLAAAQAAIAAG